MTQVIVTIENHSSFWQNLKNKEENFMKKYYQDCEKVLIEVICNGCGKKIPVKNGVAAEDYISVEKMWGYFSDKDGEHHSWELCEQCYDRITSQFAVALERKIENELL